MSADGKDTHLPVALSPAVVGLLEGAVGLLGPEPGADEYGGVRDLLRYVPCGIAGGCGQLGRKLVGAVLAFLRAANEPSKRGSLSAEAGAAGPSEAARGNPVH